MKKKLLTMITTAALVASLVSGCNSKSETTTSKTEAPTTEQTTTEATTEATTTTEETTTEATTTTEETTEETTEPATDPDETEEEPLPIREAKDVEDGTYRGGLFRVSEDGQKVVFSVGTMITFTHEEVSKMEVGQKIEIQCRELPMDTITVSSIEEDGDVLFEEYLILHQDSDGLYYLLGGSDLPLLKDEFTAELTLSPSVRITDSYPFLLSPEEEAEFDKAKKTGIPIFDTCFWWYTSRQDWFTSLNENRLNGFYEASGSCVIKISGGEVVELHIYWT